MGGRRSANEGQPESGRGETVAGGGRGGGGTIDGDETAGDGAAGKQGGGGRERRNCFVFLFYYFIILRVPRGFDRGRWMISCVEGYWVLSNVGPCFLIGGFQMIIKFYLKKRLDKGNIV